MVIILSVVNLLIGEVLLEIRLLRGYSVAHFVASNGAENGDCGGEYVL